MEKQNKVLVLMSGGVDSSTAAALLCKQGVEVSGVYLKLWEINRRDLVTISRDLVTELGDPCWAQEMRDAAKVAAHLDIPFAIWDVTKEYKERVLQNFYAKYAAGRTPNPDVLCNSEIKFGIALKRALKLGYDYVATGHYARITPPTPPLNLGGGRVILHVARDQNKDQSYFLWRLTQGQLAHMMFPLGDYTKPQVRKMAQEFGLHNFAKKDSQGICFLGKIKLKEFLYSKRCHPEAKPKDAVLLCSGFFAPLRSAQNDVSKKEGPIIDAHGNLLGFHDGLAHFTIGQRQGTRLGGSGPYYVVEKDLTRNALIVAQETDEPNYRAVRCTVREVNWIGETPVDGVPFTARTRYRAPITRVILRRQPKDPAHKSTRFFTPLRFVQNDKALEWLVNFREPERAIAHGQSIVFYEGERVMGGGIIDQVILQNTPIKVYWRRRASVEQARLLCRVEEPTKVRYLAACREEPL